MKLFSLMIGMCALLCTNRSAAATPPNIVVFLVDDMGLMDTSVPFLSDEKGQPRAHALNSWYRTPNMERLARQGVRFSQFCAMSVCSPTRVSLLTGQNAARHHVTNWINPDQNNRGPLGPMAWDWRGLDRSDTTLPKLLQQQGYRTIHIGKGHFGPNDTEGSDPCQLGFDVNIGGNSYGSPGSYYGEKNYGKGTKQAVPHLEAYHGSHTFLTEALTLEANKQIDASIRDKKPFFLYFAHYAVHSPFQANPRFAAHYAEAKQSPAAKAFATLIESMDESLGILLDHLEKTGEAKNTLVFFLGDNGSDSPLGEAHNVGSSAPLRGKKGSHYEGGVRVPFIAAWAQTDAANPHQQALTIPVGRLQTQLASVEDLFPTVLDLAGVKSPVAHIVDGRNLRPLLLGNPDDKRQSTFLMHYPHAPHRSDYWTSLRDAEWKVIYHYLPGPKGKRYQLFHLKEDPYEQNDLAEKNPAMLKRMMQQLMQSLDHHKAQYPRNKQGVELRPQTP
ncbi:MAG: sulfatase [Akkermansiaceae bacterium]